MVYLFAGLASLIHFYIFALESLLWGRAKTNKTFNVSAETAEQNRLFAFNQGFYNLFLAIGAAVGIVLDPCESGRTLIVFTCASMVGAASVLIYSNPKMIRAALVQGLAPALALLAMLL